MREGRGKYTWANGDSYEGNWDNGEQSGRGRYRYAIDDVYEGNWAHGRKNGRGYLFVKTEGKVFFEIWKNGHIAKHEELDPHQRIQHCNKIGGGKSSYFACNPN